MPLHLINRIAYIDLQNQLNTISPNGQERHLLTHGQFPLSGPSQDSPFGRPNFQFPTWSPDGQYIATIGSEGRNTALYTVSDHAQSVSLKRLYVSESQLPFYIYWSPDSHMISFVATDLQGIGLHLISLDNKGNSKGCRLLATGQPIFWDWMPESDQILIHSGINYPDAQLALIDLKREGNIGENIAQPGLFQAPAIAPNGRYWAYAEMDAYDNGQLVVADIATQEQIEVPYEGVVAFSWNPTGDRLAFIAPPNPIRRYYGPLHLLDTAAKGVRKLVDETILAFFWSPTGQHLAYFTMADTPPVQRSNPSNHGLNGNGTGNGVYKNNGLTLPSAAESAYKPADTLLLDVWVIDVTNGKKANIATVKPSSMFINQFLPFFDQFALSHRIWSPDGTALVLPVDQDNSTNIFILPIDGAQPFAIALGQIAFWSRQ
ncbi:MAG: PD40 domain-containing protein [Anaerolineae bacterium]|nr:PD40 domain-containing protein [Anaerolineae bacterium]